MAGSLEEVVQRGHPFGIVDEVDNILIDEARTPLIISGAPEEAADCYRQFARLARRAGGRAEDGDHEGRAATAEGEPEYDYEYDEKHKTVAPDRARDRRRPRSSSASTTSTWPSTATSSTTCPVAEGRVALQARQGLRRDRRRGDDHRRVHRPHPRGPALVGGPAPGGRGQGGRRRSARRTRRSRRSRSRTTSACTRSSPA